MSKIMEKGTEKCIFLDGREYTAADLYKLIALLVGNGVYANELAPTATNEDMSITHGAGHAWINGVAYRNTTPFVLEIATADGSLNRYDSLMIRLNLSINEGYAVIVQGAYATNPTPPACVRNAETFDLKLCDIYVPAGCTKITQDLIIDTRLDSSVCGVPVFPVEHLDMTTFYRQIAADLETFRENEQAGFESWATAQKATILSLLQQLTDSIAADEPIGQLITEINNKLSRTGDAMTGNLGMGSNRITKLGAPISGTDAANKDYVDTNFRPKTWIPTPEEIGATKITLLWENASPASEIGKHNIALNTDAAQYLLEYHPYGTGLTEFVLIRRGKTSRIKFFANANSPDAYVDIATRDITIEGGNMAITDAKVKSLNVTYVTTANSYLRPFRVFAVRGESV